MKRYHNLDSGIVFIASTSMSSSSFPFVDTLSLHEAIATYIFCFNCYNYNRYINGSRKRLILSRIDDKKRVSNDIKKNLFL